MLYLWLSHGCWESQWSHFCRLPLPVYIHLHWRQYFREILSLFSDCLWFLLIYCKELPFLRSAFLFLRFASEDRLLTLSDVIWNVHCFVCRMISVLQGLWPAPHTAGWEVHFPAALLSVHPALHSVLPVPAPDVHILPWSVRMPTAPRQVPAVPAKALFPAHSEVRLYAGDPEGKGWYPVLSVRLFLQDKFWLFQTDVPEVRAVWSAHLKYLSHAQDSVFLHPISWVWLFFFV